MLCKFFFVLRRCCRVWPFASVSLPMGAFGVGGYMLFFAAVPKKMLYLHSILLVLLRCIGLNMCALLGFGIIIYTHEL